MRLSVPTVRSGGFFYLHPEIKLSLPAIFSRFPIMPTDIWTNGWTRSVETMCVNCVTLSPLSSLTLSHLPHCLITISPLQPFPLSLFHPFPILPLSVDPLSPFPLSFVHPFTLSIFFLFHSSIPFPSLLRPFTSFPSLFHPFTPSALPSFTLPLLPHPFTP